MINKDGEIKFPNDKQSWVPVNYTFKFGELEIQESTCLHRSCPNCQGTGTKNNGQICVHMISCPCPRCTPRCSV